ncbi:MAG: hypothetical protein E7585_01680 [Ruminococcaceae bacterium]|nr:hypothetical protein [Oscillospiraceae bacterium]
MRYDPADYLYASARVRALEARLAGRDKLNQLLEISSVDEILNALAENGFEKEAGADKAPDRALQKAFLAVSEAMPHKGAIRFLQYPYDCHNLKAVEKSRIKRVDPAEMLIDLGSVPLKVLQTGEENELSALLPPHMAKALPRVREAFAKTGNPQEIDFILDRALYEDMAEAATVPFAQKWLTAKADLTNLLLCLRLVRMNSGELGRSTLRHAYLTVGSLDETFLLQCYDSGEGAFAALLSSTPYETVFAKEAALYLLEKKADDYLIELVKAGGSVVFGAEVPLAYLLATEALCKNIRILLAGKKAGLAADTIKERMRVCYV